MRLVRLLHKWLSLLVAIQLLIWLGSGLFFNLMDHDKARGNQYQIKPKDNVSAVNAHLLSVSEIVKQQAKSVISVKLVNLIGTPYYLLNHQRGLYQHFYNDHTLINAYTGDKTIINADMARAIAQTSYSGDGNISSIEKVAPPIEDVPKEQNALWRVNFSDSINTSVYLDASSGRLVGHSNDDKRFVDFFFMLHFMDYSFLSQGDKSGFNNWQIIFFALMTLVFCLTGFIWIINLLQKGSYRLGRK